MYKRQPLEKELSVTGRVARVEGRKAFLVGELRDGDRLCADAEALFVALRRSSDGSLDPVSRTPH